MMMSGSDNTNTITLVKHNTKATDIYQDNH